MVYIQRLPFISAATVTIIVGLVCYNSGEDTRDIYIKMLISMVGFYLLGIYLRNLITDINNQVREKKEQEELEKLKKAQEEANNKENEDSGTKEEQIVSKLDYRVDDSDDEFSPLVVSEVIKTSLARDRIE